MHPPHSFSGRSQRTDLVLAPLLLPLFVGGCVSGSAPSNSALNMLRFHAPPLLFCLYFVCYSSPSCLVGSSLSPALILLRPVWFAFSPPRAPFLVRFLRRLQPPLMLFVAIPRKRPHPARDATLGASAAHQQPAARSNQRNRRHAGTVANRVPD